MRLFPRAFSVFLYHSVYPGVFEYTDGSYGGIKKTLPTLLSLFYLCRKRRNGFEFTQSWFEFESFLSRLHFLIDSRSSPDHQHFERVLFLHSFWKTKFRQRSLDKGEKIINFSPKLEIWGFLLKLYFTRMTQRTCSNLQYFKVIDRKLRLQLKIKHATIIILQTEYSSGRFKSIKSKLINRN